MSELFIRLYLDEDVDALLAKLVRSRGFEAMTTQEAARAGATDADQPAFASEHSLADRHYCPCGAGADFSAFSCVAFN